VGQVQGAWKGIGEEKSCPAVVGREPFLWGEKRRWREELRERGVGFEQDENLLDQGLRRRGN